MLITDANPDTLRTVSGLIRQRTITAIAVLMDHNTDPDDIIDFLRCFHGSAFVTARDRDMFTDHVGKILDLLPSDTQIIALGTNTALCDTIRALQTEGNRVGVYFIAEANCDAILLQADYYLTTKGGEEKW